MVFTNTIKMNNSLLTENEAKTILEPHLGTLKQIMIESLQGLNKAIGMAGESINNRAKCALLHSVAIEKAKRYFKDCKDVIIKSKYQSIQIVFDKKLVGRIKKVNKHDLSTNAKTHRNQAILTHQLSLFPDVSNLTFIDIAYKIDAAWTEFEKLVVVCRLFEDIKWRLSYKDVTTPIIVMQPEQTEVLTQKEETQITIKKAK